MEKTAIKNKFDLWKFLFLTQNKLSNRRSDLSVKFI